MASGFRPGAWAIYRGSELPQLGVTIAARSNPSDVRPASPRGHCRTTSPSELRLRQNAADCSLWHIINVDEAGESLYGFLVVYVGEFMLLASDSIAKAVIGSIQTFWNTAEPSFPATK